LLVLWTSGGVFGQAANSPYSTFGIGESYGNALAHNQGMGGLGLSQPQYWYLNNQNPALLVFNNFTVFEVGIVGEQLRFNNGNQSGKVRGGNMNYLAIAFPLKYGKITTSLGLMPYTNVNFNLQYAEDVIDAGTGLVIDTVTVQEKGNGGLTQLYWSNGFRIYKDLALGIKASYVFGSVTNQINKQIPIEGQFIPIVSGYNQNTYAKGFLLGGGLSYSKDSLLNDDYRLSIGLIYDLRGSVPATREEEFFSINAVNGDTLLAPILNSSEGDLKLPSLFGGGISFAKEHVWSVGVDYYYQNWNTFRSLNSEEDDLGESWRMAIGGEYTPDYTSLNFFKRVTYRAGVSQAPFFANGKKVNDFGINFGISLPAGSSHIDMSFKIGKRGNVTENGLKENYIKAYLGVTLNDRWFVKRKFD
jgi:hypothetical protein